MNKDLGRMIHDTAEQDGQYTGLKERKIRSSGRCTVGRKVDQEEEGDAQMTRSW